MIFGKPLHTLVTIAGIDPRALRGAVGNLMAIRLLRRLGQSTRLAALGLLALTATAAAQGTPGQAPPPQGAPPPGATAQPASNPACVRLETQLATINAGSADPSRADQVKRGEDAVAKQQADLDRAVAQAHKQGCAGEGFFALFSGLSPQCGPITQQIQQMRGNLDRAMSDLEQLKGGNTDQESQRRALIGQLAQNNCGAQYTAAANANGPSGIFGTLFGGTVVTGDDGAPAGTYHTVCVRTCDGYYFPISYSTVPSRFADDQRTCQRLCPAAEVTLYSYQNPGQNIDQATSINGQPYTALPAAYQYRKAFTPACSCRKPGQSWADALKDADDSTTLESGDIVVNDQTAKTLSQAPQPGGKPKLGTTPLNANGTPAAPPANNAASDQGKRTIRVVGPPFVSQQQPRP
jgi:hypothetical protein